MAITDLLLSPVEVAMLGDILTATREGKRVRVYWNDQNGEQRCVEGIARHVVVSESNPAFASVWSPRRCLRVTALFEYFIPLGDIMDFEIVEG